MGKLHISPLSEVPPEGVDPDTITPGFLNINEYLARNIFNLHREDTVVALDDNVIPRHDRNTHRGGVAVYF